jgi:hypothetical protein
MPETAVHENSDALPSPNEIRLAKYVRLSPPADKSSLSQQAGETLLGGLVSFASNTGHQLGTAQTAESGFLVEIGFVPLFHAISAVEPFVVNLVGGFIVARFSILTGADENSPLAFEKTRM